MTFFRNRRQPTKTSPEHDHYFMTRVSTEPILRPVSKELQYANAFVIQFRAGAGFAKLAGRAEHVSSGNTAVFQSVDELPQLLRQMLREVRLERAPDQIGASKNENADQGR